MAADIEDEEADPVIDTGPGIADGVRSPEKQRGVTMCPDPDVPAPESVPPVSNPDPQPG